MKKLASLLTINGLVPTYADEAKNWEQSDSTLNLLILTKKWNF